MPEELYVNTAAYLPFDPELGDHGPVTANISNTLLLGMNSLKIKSSTGRRLNFKVKRIRRNYIDKLEEEFRKHGVPEWLATLEGGADEGVSKEARKALERLDSHITEPITCAEKQCRMLHKNDYDFIPKVKHWLEKGRAIRALIRYKLGREYNIANMKQTA